MLQLTACDRAAAACTLTTHSCTLSTSACHKPISSLVREAAVLAQCKRYAALGLLLCALLQLFRDTAVLECLLRLRQCCLARTLIAPERLARAKAALADMDRLVDDTASKVHPQYSH
jgi:hypothetical protein